MQRKQFLCCFLHLFAFCTVSTGKDASGKDIPEMPRQDYKHALEKRECLKRQWERWKRKEALYQDGRQ